MNESLSPRPPADAVRLPLAAIVLLAPALAVAARWLASDLLAVLLGACAGLVCALLLWQSRRAPPAATPVAVPQRPLPASEPPTHELVRKLQSLQKELDRLRAVEAELTAAKRDAEAAANAKGEFLATMSHEIRTPLNGIIPILELLLRDPLADELRAQVQAAFVSAREMLRIVNDVLDFSRLESGNVELEVSTFKPREIVDSVCTLMRRAAQRKSLELHCEIDASVPPMLRGDTLRLRQVLSNLIGNAIKFTERGSVSVRVAQVAHDRIYRVLRFSIVDTGEGIAPHTASRLFQPFSQADASTSRTHGGTGLGLAISRGLVEAMGGQIGVESMVGTGSTFWFTLPLLRPAGEAGADDAPTHRAVMLSRDEPFAADWQRRLALVGVNATRVETAYEALSAVRESRQRALGRCELVIIDVLSNAATVASIMRPLLRDEEFATVKLVLIGEPGAEVAELCRDPRVCVVERAAVDGTVLNTLREHVTPSTGLLRAAARTQPAIELKTDYGDLFAGLSVLLVDDIQINRYAGQKTLEKLGMRVQLASGGREAIAMMESQRFDIVLMDCQMPDVNGFEATRVRRLREEKDGLPRLPILAVTANAMAGDRERCLESGMDDHLAKPIELPRLVRLLGRWAPRVDADGQGANDADAASHRALSAG